VITGYSYELWDGEKVLGHYQSLFPIYSNHLVVPELTTLKQPYSKKVRQIKVPVTSRIISDTKVDIHIRIVLDVRRKSKRQIQILKGER
jgi:hypothetical protein